MKIKLIVVGKTNISYLKTGIEEYKKRLKHYLPFEMYCIPELKNLKKFSEKQIKEREGELILKQLSSGDLVFLLDEIGKQYNSVNFAKFLETKMIAGNKSLAFVIGGAYGFSEAVYKWQNYRKNLIALSAMTFSHQMIRLLFVEQLYRAMTIIRGEPYHHS